MASREKRTLASSKLKQKASNNDSNPHTSPGKKSSSSSAGLSASKLLEAVATGSQLPSKLEASLPRKRALQTALKRNKQKTTAVKKTALVVKVKHKVAKKTTALKKINPVGAKRKKKLVSTPTSSVDSGLNTSNESDESKKTKTGKKKGLAGSIAKYFIPQESPAKVKSRATLITKIKEEPLEEQEQEQVQEEQVLLVNVKTEPGLVVNNDSYEDTIEEVIQSSMLVAVNNQQQVKPSVKDEEPEDQKVGPGKRLLVRNPVAKRALRNGRLRRTAPDIKTETDLDDKKPLGDMSAPELETSLDDCGGMVLKTEEPDPPVANHVQDSESSTNNNADDPDSGGPKLRSKTKTPRNSDSGCSDIDVASSKTEDPKYVLKNRRSSLNIELNNSTRRSSSDSVIHSDIDEMINKVKESIAKKIEIQITKEKMAKVSALRKSFEASRRSSVNSPLSSDDIRIENGELKVNAIVHTELNPDMKTNDVQNSVPKVADTAKEIEKLVMGDCELAETQPPTNDVTNNDKPSVVVSQATVNASDVNSVPSVVSADKLAEVKKEEQKLDDLDINAITKLPEDVKKPATRKSTRTTAGRSSSMMELKKPLICTEVSDESDKPELDKKFKEKEKEKEKENEKTDAATPDTNTVNNVTESVKVKEEEVVEDKSTPTPEVDTSEPAEVKAEDDKMDVSVPIMENCQADETLESLSRELEMLVEADDNDQQQQAPVTESTEVDKPDTMDHENSDVEMQLMIDEESVSEKVEEQAEECDPKVPAVEEKQEEIKTEETDTKPSPESEEVEGDKKGAKRVLRTRGEKQKKPVPSANETSEEVKTNLDESTVTPEVPSATKEVEDVSDASSQTQASATEPPSKPSEPVEVKTEPVEEPQIRTRRTREAKKSLTLMQHPIKVGKRGKKSDVKKPASSEPMQPANKEETLLDNEVAKINENNRSRSSSLLKSSALRGVSENAQKLDDVPDTKNRSKSENDLQSSNSQGDVKPAKSEEDASVATKSYADEGSSSSSDIQESPEEKAKKESILGVLGLESWEKVNARKKKEQEQEQHYTGSLKTVIRLKEKDKKKRSRSPLKMVIKQQQTGRQVEAGETTENMDFYIQKEDGPSFSGDSSGTEEDDENATTAKDRQSLVIPEKSSSFSIHPGRLCADNCCYCHGKFGSLDTPMHLAQMKSQERKERILNVMKHLTKDSCLCDACYRHVDRRVNVSPTTQLKPQRQNRQSMYPCSVVNCTEVARHHVKRRWLCRIKTTMKNLDINWESGQHNLLAFCVTHFSQVEQILTCTLCHKRLTRNSSQPLGLTPEATEELNQRLRDHGVPTSMAHNMFLCKTCKLFTKLHLKHSDLESMTPANQEFCTNYSKKLQFMDMGGVADSEEEPDSNNHHQSFNTSTSTSSTTINNNDSSSKPPQPSTSTSGSVSISVTKKSKSRPGTPKPESRSTSIEGAIEKLKKRKAIDALDSSSTHSVSILKSNSAKNVVDLLALDKEVTLTRLSKKPRLENNNCDITPVVQRLGANPSISVRTLFPGEEEMNLQANVEFNNVREITPQGWEKCATMIQYDKDTKMLWQELQRPYGNQSSFLRHLILLEKYYRAGDLILAPNASRNAINYSTSVQNRLISYEGPEKTFVEEPIVEISTVSEFNSKRGTVTTKYSPTSSIASLKAQLSKLDKSECSSQVKLTPAVSIIKKPSNNSPVPSLHRLNSSNNAVNGSAKRKESIPVQKFSGAQGGSGSGKIIQMSQPQFNQFKRLQSMKRRKDMINDNRGSSPQSSAGTSNSTASTSHPKQSSQSSNAQYQKAAQLDKMHLSQFQKHLLMQQEMLNQRSRGDFEPLICDIRSLANENAPTMNLLSTINLPKSIQITTKSVPGTPMATSSPIPILPKIPKSLTVIPQTVSRGGGGDK